MSKKNWERKECSGCKLYNPECKQGACSLYPYEGRSAHIFLPDKSELVKT